MRSFGPWSVVAVVVVLASLAVPARAQTAVDEPAAAATEPAAAAAGPTSAAAEPTMAAAEPTTSARAPRDPATVFAPAPERPAKDAPFALAVNAPWAWLRHNIGGSVYVAVDPHWAMRANFAQYDADELLPALAASFEGAIYRGDIVDLGLGWIWYPRRLWDGFMFEAGALMRDRDVRRIREDEPDLDIQTTTYAARAMVGWSWLAGRTVFISAALGASAGLESGHESFVSEAGMATTRSTQQL